MRKRIIAVATVLLVNSYVILGANITSIADGDWNNVSTWDCNCIPSTSDDVNIKHDITSSGSQEVNSMNFGTAWSPSTSYGTLHITGGTITVNGNINFGVNGQSFGELTIDSGAKFVSTGTIIWNQGATINVFGELEGNSFTVANGNGGEFNVDADGSVVFSGDVNIGSGPHTFNIDGSMEVENMTLSGAAQAEVNGNLDINNSLTIANDGNRITGTGTVSAASADCPGDDCGIGTEEEVTLPVELISFILESQKTEIIISWQTAIEINNDHFNLYRSNNGQHFDLIQTVAGYGTTNEPQQYSLVDYPERAGMYYYRLEQVDFDGKNEIFPMSKIHFNPNKDKQKLAVYPIPLRSNQNIQLDYQDSNETVSAQLFDLSGNLKHEVEIERQGQRITYKTENLGLKSGIYILRTQIGIESFSQKIRLN